MCRVPPNLEFNMGGGGGGGGGYSKARGNSSSNNIIPKDERIGISPFREKIKFMGKKGEIEI